jgi:hypothetical protein
MTALQQFIELIKEHNEDFDAPPFMQNDTIIELAKSLLEIEKVQIIKAYQQGVTDEHGDTITFTTEGEDYYNSTYKS